MDHGLWIYDDWNDTIRERTCNSEGSVQVGKKRTSIPSVQDTKARKRAMVEALRSKRAEVRVIGYKKHALF